MPKIVDHEARRRHIAEALLRIISRDGLDAVSLREVAAEAEVSMGMVQHYFSTKDEMLMFALAHLNARIGERVARAAAAGSPRALVRAGLLELLPLDEERAFEARIGLAYLARSVVAEDLAALLRAALPYVVGFYAEQIRTAQALGQVYAGLDAGKEATILFTMAQGMVNPALIGHLTPEQVEAAVDYQLDRLFPSR
ncbi:transcriptional regulator [Planotetraspora thailandica]|uniref:Transcriptional regulator n=1 Tax=Planotetraspora thailandica TaxID=487172 RepID=A0A8J3V4L2_9ACTN|nr:TetR/AcrR family transcriptional regulator [Planotetraspora thailandica]GII57684.1 transcriptional regulator [Planotetraspora thailandica]